MQNKITIIPDAHSNTAIRFVDVKNYFLQVGEELTWFNGDFVDHTLVLMNEDNTTGIADLDLHQIVLPLVNNDDDEYSCNVSYNICPKCELSVNPKREPK